MNSALKPVLTPSGPQNPPVTTQLNKPMHPQGAPSTYGQPSTHLPQGLVNLSHNNPTVAHSHPNPAHQSNHYSLNVPNAPQHYSTNNPSTIPASNHPVPMNQTPSGGQNYTSPSKNAQFAGGYQPNLGHPPNQNPLPPVSQTLPATQPPQHPSEVPLEKPQSNGTTEVKSPLKPEPQENHIHLSKEKSPVPSSPKPIEKPAEEKTTLPTASEQKPKQDTSKSTEEVKLPSSELSPKSNESTEASSEPINSSEIKENIASAPASEATIEEDLSPPESVESVTTDTSAQHSPNKTKEKNITPKNTPRTPTSRKSKTPKSDGESPKSTKVEVKASTTTQKSPNLAGKSKRTRIKTQPYQSPLPEIEIITKISSSAPKTKANDDKIIVFYKNEFLAVRNSEGSFYICQAVQNIYKSSPKIRIRWLSQDKTDKSVYTPDFYDNTDFDCILTNLNLSRVDKGRYRLPPAEKERTDSILKRSLAVEKGEVTSPSLTEEHPDGIDVSLYKEEGQLKKRKGTKRRARSSLRAGRQAPDTPYSPEKAKVRKVVPKTRKKPPRTTSKSRKTTTVTTVVDVKKTNSSTSRTDRAKRRNDNQNHNKVSPVVDQKKAKVLAKVARKAAVAPKSQSQNKNVKPTKAPSTPTKKGVVKTATRKTKRSSRK